MKEGDKIRDIEDGDCYFEGTVKSIDPLTYTVERIVWDGEEDKEDKYIGKTIKPMWWQLLRIEELNN